MLHSRDFKKIYHPTMGRYVYMHRGHGLIVDNVLKPLAKGAKYVAKPAIQGAKYVGNKIVAPFVKRQAKKGAEKLGEKLIQKATERSGDLIRKRLSASSKRGPRQKTKKSQQDVNAILNNLIAMS